MADLEGRFVDDAGQTRLEGKLVVPAGIDAGFVNGAAVNNGATALGQMLMAVGASNVAFGDFMTAAAAPVAAPTTGDLPIYFDSTAVTGGLYLWLAAAWVKVSTIP